MLLHVIDSSVGGTSTTDATEQSQNNDSNIKYYRSQFTYQNGILMCTTVCFHWLVSNILGWTEPMCLNKVMDSIMSWSADIHQMICNKQYGHCKMLYQSELIEQLKVPTEIQVTEICGSDICAHLPDIDSESENIIFVTFDQLPNILKQNCGMMLTVGAHTVGVLNMKGSFYVFDPAKASVQKFAYADGGVMITGLRNNEEEFDGTLFKLK